MGEYSTDWKSWRKKIGLKKYDAEQREPDEGDQLPVCENKLQEEELLRQVPENKSRCNKDRKGIKKQSLSGGPMTAKQMLMQDLRSTGWSFADSDQEGNAKQTKLHSTNDCGVRMGGGFELRTIDELG